MRILTAAEMRAAEEAAVAAGTSFETLMENAGRAAAEEIARLAAARGLEKSMLLLCGKGNNAGDAFVVARLLAARGWRAQVLLLCGEKMSALARLNWQRLPPSVEKAMPCTANFGVGVLVDGVFGTGFSGRLPPGVQRVFTQANAADAARVALDLPSGLDCDSGAVAPDTFCAALTVTFGAYKPGLVLPQNAPVVGEVKCVDIGL
ncbi:MAG: NAD(P)H-hydrate epimerase [Oscillospiraceae bacterium]